MGAFRAHVQRSSNYGGGGDSGGTVRSSAVRIPRFSTRPAPAGSSSFAHGRAPWSALVGRSCNRAPGRVGPHLAASGSLRLHVRPQGGGALEPDRGHPELATGSARGGGKAVRPAAAGGRGRS